MPWYAGNTAAAQATFFAALIVSPLTASPVTAPFFAAPSTSLLYASGESADGTSPMRGSSGPVRSLRRMRDQGPIAGLVMNAQITQHHEVW